ncbi:efflux RND transporter periplasmic adaptor subunit [Dyadobacter sp. CY312]|uniref:efflux RND transporter periplasmic adaptor subunit n=1 Tax=Dyadobacter sp. CY312 TaxID=2907303 RepID=UPI001F2844D6|nr:efflux RND transporter periplasmic adaptor subunit [Dyadobacter sp. CY312]MCE7042417.1 efflux RND transporter periplasmic adaptor subunit [Dyadobacter sp. CY312]
MKKIIITIVVLVVAGVLVGTVLTNNKKKNEQKIEIVNKGTGAAAVKVVTVAKKTLDSDFSSNGNFVPNQDLKLLSETSGVVTGIRVKEGDRVSKGQILATIDQKYLSIDLETAEDSYQKIKVDQQRYESSFKTGGVTQSQVDDINLQLRNAANKVEQAKRKIGDAHIKAPISGIINKKHIEVGAYLGTATALFDIVDVSQLKLNVSVNESQVVQLQTGSKVDIKVPVFPDQTFTGRVSFIAPKADASLNFPMEIKVDNDKGNKIRAGMYGTAVFKFEKQAESIVIPRSAFVGSVNANQVYVLEGDKVRLTKVTPGAIIGESVIVLAGLNEGQSVVVTGQINLVDGATVAVQKN